MMEMEELLLTGRIRFPLKNREELVTVKRGNVEWGDLENRLVSMMNHVEALQHEAPYVGIPDAGFAMSCILSCYGLSAPGGKLMPSVRRWNSRFDAGFDIPSSTAKAIYEKLSVTEQSHDIRILYCCESGSRGWNFASPDSDFDVRFIYAHPKDWYLSIMIEDKPDVLDLGIEKTEAGELDVNGWELRKALKLLRKSNGSLIEWLSSPIVYRAEPLFLETMLKFAEESFNPLAVWHHYRGMFERSAECFEETPSIKSLFYMLRPLLCMKWIEDGRGLPPMRFDKIAETVIHDDGAKQEIFHLVEVKKSGRERTPINISSTLREFIRSEVSESKPPQAPLRGTRHFDIDVFFRKILEKNASSGSVFTEED